MPAQRMRLEAEMRDNASPAVRKLREELNNLQAASADTRGVAKLNAEVAKLQTSATVDASPAVKKLRAELAALEKATAENRAVAGLTKDIAALKRQSDDIRSTAGMKAFRSWISEAKEATTGFLGPIKELPGILSAVGVTGLAAGLSASKLAEDLKNLGTQQLVLKELAREVGMTTDQLTA